MHNNPLRYTDPSGHSVESEPSEKATAEGSFSGGAKGGTGQGGGSGKGGGRGSGGGKGGGDGRSGTSSNRSSKIEKQEIEKSDVVTESDSATNASKLQEEQLETKKFKEGTDNTVGKFAGEISAENIPNMSKQEILDSLPKDWKYTENNGFVHVRDADGNIRMRIDPPDKVTKYDHVHLFDEKGNPIDLNLNVVDRKSPDAHIPYKK
ncbi:hypothetical protein [Paenibacillus campi]|uniref:hypothetical protein n=1 Tax=Paenibacillus campi TaxID=3106031 RepID=UPI002AFFD7D7|nr:hypothetical protein [Paenibacillus sp. SGZ-1009]